MPGNTRIDPIVAAGFHVVIDGENVMTVKEVDGIEIETDVRELVQSSKDGKQVMIKTQGAMTRKMGKVTLKYAAFKGDSMMKWRKLVVEGQMEKARKSMSIVAYTVDDKKSMQWDFEHCWPSKYSWSGFNATSNDPVIVTVVIEHEGMKLNK